MIKKTKHFIPLGLTTIAPICCLVSCSGNILIIGQKIELNLTREDKDGDPESDLFIFESQPTALKKDNTYTIIADLNKLQYFDEAKYFIITKSDFSSVEDLFDIQKITVDKTQMNKIEKPEDLKNGGWMISDSILGIQPKQNEKFKTDGCVYVTFKSKIDTQDSVTFRLANES